MRCRTGLLGKKNEVVMLQAAAQAARYLALLPARLPQRRQHLSSFMFPVMRRGSQERSYTKAIR
jgi:hypothetical protein